jgi:hypothetical protein
VQRRRTQGAPAGRTLDGAKMELAARDSILVRTVAWALDPAPSGAGFMNEIQQLVQRTSREREARKWKSCAE